MNDRVDVVVVGGGHNALTAAAYLARAGLSVRLLERSSTLGGATVSAQVFPGQDARLSRYSYLVSLLPQRIVDDLGLDLQLLRRRYSSYTPRPGTDTGLLIDDQDAEATAASFAGIGAPDDAAPFAEFYERTGRLASAIWPTMTEPLPTRSRLRDLVGDETIWADFVERPLGEVIERSVHDDLVRGVLLTDGLISTFAQAHQSDLQQNICFLYHVIGGGDGAWDVPVGGMGSVAEALERAAREAGADLRTGVEVTALQPAPDGVAVQFVPDGRDAPQTLHADHVLVGAAPAVLDELLAAGTPTGDTAGPAHARGQVGAPTAEGAQVKVNLLLSRLPALREPDLGPAAAFGGTFHVQESYAQLQRAHDTATEGHLPSPIPLEIYCHSLTDPSILGAQLRASGAQTMTVFALQVPHRLLANADPTTRREQFQQAVLDSLDSVLAEPIADLLLTDSAGRPCIETRTTADLHDSLRMPGGSIFHGPLSWPFVEDDEDLSTPARAWGVGTAEPRILMCGAGSRRGGGVSGLGGFHAAQALLCERAAN